MTPVKEYGLMIGMKPSAIISRIANGTIRGFKWGVHWFVLEDYEEIPPSKIMVALPKRGPSTVASLERRVEELEWAVKELQCIIAARGYKMTKAIVGRAPNENRRKHEPSNLSRRIDNHIKPHGGPNIPIPRDLLRMVPEE